MAMKFTISWLKKYLITEATTDQIIDKLTQIGFEVEEVINHAEIYKPFIIAEIVSTVPHPNADKLRVCQVNNSKETLQIVCGAPNARAGIKVVLAPVGAEIPVNGLKIKQSKIREIESNGMLCSASELLLSEDSDGIIELNDKYTVGNSFAEEHGLNETIVEVSVGPNRGDCFGIYGIARDLAAAGLGQLKPLTTRNEEGYFTSPIKVTLESSKCPRYYGRYFKDIKNSNSPKWLKKDLELIGVKPISALVDITNYFTFAFGRPMHVFDADLISQIQVRGAKEGDEFTALNDKTYKLHGDELVIADGNKTIALAGIIGDKNTGVSLTTKNVFLEIGLFDADSVTKSARMHHIDTDAKFRFERKIDADFMETALNLATNMISEICGGTPSHPVIIDNLETKKITIDFPLSELKKRLGVEYEKARVMQILSDLGFQITDKGNNFLLTSPSWRHDIAIKEDIVEEVVRIDGYDKIPSTSLPNLQNVTLNHKQSHHYKISRFPASLGLNEVVTMSFMNSKKAALFSELKEELYIQNPISSELNYMRPSILPNLLEAAEHNQNRGINNIRIFEFSSIFQGIKPDQQIMTITALRKGHNHDRNHYSDYRHVDVFDSKSDIFNIITELGLDPNKLQYNTGNLPKYYHPGRSSALTLGKNIIGYFGELHPSIIQSYNLNGNAVGFELFIDNIPLTKPKYGRKGNAQFSDYQAVHRDFAFIVNKDIASDAIIKLVSQTDKKLIRSVNIFDIYEGKNIEEGKKSIAFSITIQAQDRTLLDEELESLSKKIIDTVIQNTQGSLRGA